MTFYDSPDVHRLLIADQVRTRAFRESIINTIHAIGTDATVLDVGAGAGILSLFAAQAGARRVYAVERAPHAAQLAERLVQRNKFADVIHVIPEDVASVVLPERVDVLVSEWLGAYGVDENMLAPVLVARDRWLKPDGLCIPSTVTGWLAPVAHPAASESVAFLTRPFDLDLSDLAPFSPDEAIWLPEGVARTHLRAEPQPLWTVECRTMAWRDAQRPYAAELTFRLNGGDVNAVAAWFSAEMPGAKPLSNGPDEPPTHWGQFLFPIANAGVLDPGDQLQIGFHNVPWGAVGSQHIWASRVEGRPLEVHDTRRRPNRGWAPPWRVYEGTGRQSWRK